MREEVCPAARDPGEEKRMSDTQKHAKIRKKEKKQYSRSEQFTGEEPALLQCYSYM